MDLATAVTLVIASFMYAILVYYLIAPSLVPNAINNGLLSSSFGSIISYVACYSFMPGTETVCLVAGGISALWGSLATLYFCKK
jgi:hypothetical protein